MIPDSFLGRQVCPGQFLLGQTGTVKISGLVPFSSVPIFDDALCPFNRNQEKEVGKALAQQTPQTCCFPYIQAVLALLTCVTMTVIVFPGSHSTVRFREPLREMKHALFSQGSHISALALACNHVIFHCHAESGEHPYTRFHVV